MPRVLMRQNFEHDRDSIGRFTHKDDRLTDAISEAQDF